MGVFFFVGGGVLCFVKEANLNLSLSLLLETYNKVWLNDFFSLFLSVLFFREEENAGELMLPDRQ